MARSPIAAIRRAVRPLGLRRSTLAPRCSSSFATHRCPPAAAACSSPRPFSASASTCPLCCSHSTTCCSSPLLAAAMTSFGSSSHDARAVGSAEGGAAEASCRLAGLSSTAPASPSTATAYRLLAASKRPTTPHRPLSSGRAWRPSMRTRWPERSGVGTAAGALGLAACCLSSSAMAAWPLVSAHPSAVSPPTLRTSMLASAASSSCTHSVWPLSILALYSSSRRAMAYWLIPAATMRAVVPQGLRRSMLAPRCSSSFAMCRRPPDAAACSNPSPFSADASTCPLRCSHSTTSCRFPRSAATKTSPGSSAGSHVVLVRAIVGRSGVRAAGTAEGVAAEDPSSSCRLAGLSSTASASPSTATAYRPLVASKCPATPHRPLSQGRAWRLSMRTRRPERLGVGAAAVAGGVAACCRSSLAMAARSLASACPSAVQPS
eukprot:scaffold77959_cov64-Phaeocystis_antarctica.AAC.2